MEIEKSLARLEEIAKLLEKGVSLDESIKLYEEGIILAKNCTECLEVAKGKITEIKNGKEKKLNILETEEENG